MELTDNTTHEIQDHWIGQDSVEPERCGLANVFRQTFRMVVMRLGSAEAAGRLSSRLPPSYAFRQLQGVVPWRASIRHGPRKGLTEYESEGRASALPTNCAALHAPLRPKLLGQRGVSSWCLETGQRHARRMGSTGKRPLHPCLPKPHRPRPATGGLSSYKPPRAGPTLDFSIFLDSHVSEDEKKICLGLLGQRTYVGQPREPQTPHEEQPGDLVQLPSEQLLLEEEEHEQQMAEKAETRKKQQMWNNERTARLGTHPRESRRQLQESLDQGFYVAVSSKKKIRTLHPLGECCLLPTLDYTTFSFLGPRLPSRSLYDQNLQVVCEVW